MLTRDMWVFPLVAAVIASVFSVSLGRRFERRRGPHHLAWAIAMALYAAASLAVALGAAGGWTATEFHVYWALGAVLNVPFLAAGQMLLLTRRPWVSWASSLVLVFLTAYTVAVLRGSAVDAAALAADLPSGKHVFGDGSPAHRLPQVVSIPSYLVLLAGVAWSVWSMRGRREHRGRRAGSLFVAIGATVVAGFGSTFAALGHLEAFSVALLAGIAVMFWGFLLASRSSRSSGSPDARVIRHRRLREAPSTAPRSR